MKCTDIYRPDQLHEVLKQVRPYFRLAYNNNKQKYFNVPCAFDIETSSFYEEPDGLEFEGDEIVYKYILKHTIRYNEQISHDIPDFNVVRLKAGVRLSKNKGSSVDSLYSDLSSQFPYYFPEDVINPSDQLIKILDILKIIKPVKHEKQEKCACMYVWQFGIFGAVIIGRTWKEFIDMLSELTKELTLRDDKRLLVYVHNLSWEFQFFRKYFAWKKVFSVSPREPVYALTYSGIEFRCSYILSGYNLAHLGENLHKYKVNKLVGDLDYSLIRHNKTPLTDKELDYCSNDVRVVMAFIMESIEQDGNIAKIPLTKTGYARNYVRRSCWYTPGIPKKEDFKRLHYMQFIKGLNLDPDEYLQLKRAFQGGFTHTNPFKANKVLYDITSFDFTSSYPAVMIAEKFPMSTGELVQIKSKEDFENNLSLYWCLFDIEFFDIEPLVTFENYISRSRCTHCENAVVNNGRVVSSSRLVTTITGEDYQIIQKFYKWSHMRIFNFRRYKKAYLPTDFIKAILKLYSDKTTLKGVKGKEVEYLVSKGLLNSTFGMCCTDIVRTENVYINDQWEQKEPDLEEMINKYNKSNSRFMFYPWGVAITSYARRNLFTGILEFKDDYCYSDTDSIKVLNADKHKDYIEQYNKWIIDRLQKAMLYHGLDPDEISPKTIKGESKPLGVWDFDGHYQRAKFLGAKRYMVEYDSGDINITVSGLNKKTAVPYICTGWCYDLDGTERKSPFDMFTNNMYIPPEHTGKKTHTYIDEEQEGYITDYMGNTAYYHELSGVHLSDQDYSLSISREYADYLSCLVYV